MFDTIVLLGPVSVSALAVQMWELAIHWSDEVEYLWTGRLSFIKVLYFAVRYLLIAAQIVSEYLSFRALTEHSRAACTAELAFTVVLAQGSLTLLEVILLIRVYALYNQGRHVRWLLGGIFLIVMLFETSATGRILAQLGRSTDCKPPHLDRLIIIHFGIGAGSCQLVVFVLSLNGLLLRRGARTPLTTLMLKEGIAAFLLIIALLVVMMVHYELFRTFDHGVGKAAFAWYISLISVGASRLILNMRRLAVKSMRRRALYTIRTGTPDPVDSDDDVCLTSFYD